MSLQLELLTRLEFAAGGRFWVCWVATDCPGTRPGLSQADEDMWTTSRRLSMSSTLMQGQRFKMTIDAVGLCLAAQ
eukprot:1872534-Amphidinium_carterae.2